MRSISFARPSPLHGLQKRLIVRVLLMSAFSAWSGMDAYAAGQHRGSELTTRQNIYRYDDSQGTVHLTNVPVGGHDANRYSIVVEGPLEQALSNPRVASALPRSPELRAWVEEAARSNQIESSLLYAVMLTESGYNPDAVSPKGARGLMQLMPQTASAYGVENPFDSRQSIMAGAQHLRTLLDSFGHDVSLAVAAYNAGAAAVTRYHNSIPPFEETQRYVPRVLDLYRQFQTAKTGRL